MELIIDEINKNLLKKQRILIGISGIPGSGKSTFSQKILKIFPEKTIIIPLDGFHKYLSEFIIKRNISTGRDYRSPFFG